MTEQIKDMIRELGRSGPRLSHENALKVLALLQAVSERLDKVEQTIQDNNL